MTATACQSPQLSAITDVLFGVPPTEVEACRDEPIWRVRLERAGIVVEVTLCQVCKDSARTSPGFAWAHSLAAEKANV